MPHHTRLLSCAAALACALPGAAALAFDAADLKGQWAESTQSRYACAPSSRRQRLALTPDGQTLRITLLAQPGKHKQEVIELHVIKSDSHSLYFEMPRGAAASAAGSDEWAISMLGPGVYRWHVTSEHDALKTAPIGVRCEPRPTPGGSGPRRGRRAQA